MMEVKSLFVPLNGEHYDRFQSGLKTFELRRGPKRWNSKTVYTSRPQTLSRGYGKKNRMHGTIGAVYESKNLYELLTFVHDGKEIWRHVMPHTRNLKEAHLHSLEIYGDEGDFIAFEFCN